MPYDILRLMISEVPILGTYGHIFGASSDWDDPTPLPMGPYPFFSPNTKFHQMPIFGTAQWDRGAFAPKLLRVVDQGR